MAICCNTKEKTKAATALLAAMSAAAAAVVVQHLGFGACPDCPTKAQQMCPDPWHHLACAVCRECESLWDYREEHHQECPAAAIARLSATCKMAAAQRDPIQVQKRALTTFELKQQFENTSDPDTNESWHG